MVRGPIPMALQLEVVRFLPASWITGNLVASAFNSSHGALYRALITAPDRCHVCDVILTADSPYVLRVDPCGCLVHAPCALDDVISEVLRSMVTFSKPALWCTCPRCSMPRCTNLEYWFQTMCMLDPRLFHH